MKRSPAEIAAAMFRPIPPPLRQRAHGGRGSWAVEKFRTSEGACLVPGLGALMLNPLDAFRINALFALEKIPAEAAGKTPLAGWWLTRPGLWLAIISTTWTLTLLCLANRRGSRLEV